MGTELTPLFKIFRNDSPPYLKEHVHLPRNISYCSKRSNTLNEVKCRTRKYMNSFFPNCIEAWNNIDEILRNCDTISKYKRKHFFYYVAVRKKVTQVVKIKSSSIST